MKISVQDSDDWSSNQTLGKKIQLNIIHDLFLLNINSQKKECLNKLVKFSFSFFRF
jgi:hypothetical protein